MTTMNPYESAKFIVENANFVRVNDDGIKRLTKEIIDCVKSGEIDVNNFSQHELHPKSTDSHAIEWIFVVDTLNFCFWSAQGNLKYHVNGHTGYFALCAAINRAIVDGYDIINSEFYSKIDLPTLEHIFRSDDGDTKIPLLKERMNCLHEVGKRLIDKWNGKFENVINAANNSAIKLLELIVKEFPCFRDEADFMGKRVSFYKRAQILVGDIWSCFRGEGIGAFDHLDQITMFADYRIPQVLIHFECLSYNQELNAKLEKKVVLLNGSAAEVEIRGASIYIVEKVKEAVIAELIANNDIATKNKINSILIDQYLWDYRRKHANDLEHIPFHKTLSVYY